MPERTSGLSAIADAGAAKAGGGVDGRLDQTDRAVDRVPHPADRVRMAVWSGGKAGEIAFGHIGAQFQCAVADDDEQRLACRRGDGAKLGVAGRDDAGDRGHDLGARQLQIDIGHLGRHQLFLGMGRGKGLGRHGHARGSGGRGGLGLVIGGQRDAAFGKERRRAGGGLLRLGRRGGGVGQLRLGLGDGGIDRSLIGEKLAFLQGERGGGQGGEGLALRSRWSPTSACSASIG